MSNSATSADLRRPTARGCERCGRKEQWDHMLGAWQLVSTDDGKVVGNPHCIHEWDINGSFRPVGLD